MRKFIKKLLLLFVILIIVVIAGSIINNRIFYIKYSNASIDTDSLSEKDIDRIHDVYNYLTDSETIFKGFNDNKLDLIVYNEAYEFLFCNSQPSDPEWIYLDKDTITSKLIYRRTADNPQAFAVRLDTSWVGSFATLDTYHKQILEQIPFFFPPQLVSVDEAYYRALVIHEMTHAYQGILNPRRVEKSEHIHNVCSSYYTDNLFNQLLEQEAVYLETAINSNDPDIIKENVINFLQIRDERRIKCNMTDKDRKAEEEIEWLEGLARYSEYKASRDSLAPIAKQLASISEKVKVKSDDRYYTLGMAEYMIIVKAEKLYDKNIFTENTSLENILREIY